MTQQGILTKRHPMVYHCLYSTQRAAAHTRAWAAQSFQFNSSWFVTHGTETRAWLVHMGMWTDAPLASVHCIAV